MDTKNSFNLLSDTIKDRLAAINISQATEVQNQIIPVINQGRNILFESETGTGKTYAYLLPLINRLEEDEKKDVVLRLAKMTPISPEVLQRVDKAMYEKSLSQTSEKAENIDGRNALAQILKKMDVGAENDILTYLSEDDPDLGQDLRSRLFTMDDVVKSDDRFVQEKLREMTEVDIAFLIAAKPDDFREKILSNISAGRRAEVRAQEDILKPMRRSDCERITSEFFSKLRRAYEEGHLIIQDRNDDVFV